MSIAHHFSLSLSTNLDFPPLKPVLSFLSWLDQSHALFGSGGGGFMGLNQWVWFELVAELVDGFELVFLGFISAVAKSVG